MCCCTRVYDVLLCDDLVLTANTGHAVLCIGVKDTRPVVLPSVLIYSNVSDLSFCGTTCVC